jgi:hypothetical protein
VNADSQFLGRIFQASKRLLSSILQHPRVAMTIWPFGSLTLLIPFVNKTETTKFLFRDGEEYPSFMKMAQTRDSHTEVDGMTLTTNLKMLVKCE